MSSQKNEDNTKNNKKFDVDNVIFIAVTFVCGGISAALFDQIFEIITKNNNSNGWQINGLLIISLLVTFVALVSLNRIRLAIRRDFFDIHSSVKKIANATYDEVRHEISQIRKEIDKNISDTHVKTTSEISEIRREILSVVSRQFNLHRIGTRYIKNGQNHDPGYLESLKRIKEAKNSIFIIGDYSPYWQRLQVPNQRNAYLEAIEQKVLEQIKDRPFDDFRYIRIVQRDREIINSMQKTNAILPQVILRMQDMIGDEQIYEHCCQLMQYDREKPDNARTEISVRVCPPIPNSPSTLIIDNKYILFTIPVKTSSDIHQTDGVLLFEDLDGGKAIVSAFVDIFLKINAQTIQVVEVESSATP